MEEEWFSGVQGFWWLIGGESAGSPAAALGLQRWEGVLTNCSECSGFSRMDQEMVSPLELSNLESAQQKGPGWGRGGQLCRPSELLPKRHLIKSIPEFQTSHLI